MQGDILQRMAAIPGVTSAAFVTNVPMDPGMSAICPVEGKDYGENFRKLLPIPRTIKFISPGFFQTAGTSLVAGRDLTWVEINEQRNVLGMMPHPDRSSEDILGSADGKLIFESMVNALVAK